MDSMEAQRTYYRLLKRADAVVVLGDPPAKYGEAKELLLARNRKMVDVSNLLLAVWDGSPGGTAYTVRYAQKAGVPVLRLDPQNPRRWEWA